MCLAHVLGRQQGASHTKKKRKRNGIGEKQPKLVSINRIFIFFCSRCLSSFAWKSGHFSGGTAADGTITTTTITEKEDQDTSDIDHNNSIDRMCCV